MDLRLWTFGPIEYHPDSSTDLTTEYTFENPVPVLGIIWARNDDTLSISIKDVSVSENLSKREILVVTQAIFDPLGFLAPVLLPAKLLLQQIWATKSDWDTPLPEEIKVFEMGESFPESGNSVNGFLVERDQRSLLSVKTKIIERDDDYAFRYPVLLPSKHHVVDCLIREYHLKHSHAGIQALIAITREEFWIIEARHTIRSVVKKCVRCKRFKTKPPTTFPIQLPLNRVRDAETFEVTGIDLCGPLILRSKTKAWVVLFTCAVYRCVHLEVVTSINTEYFIQALRRFIARRGWPSVIYTDNGTNFTGTSTMLRKVDWEKVVSQETLNPINWKFIPPTAVWWGGW
ncbi:hypothetical protein AVEN_20271-1 [Araneus ventricosus]|uniref:Integrase zinc-binding domain-containing protein n=1 Tax=Araneus ventricosus TaxID=182803 RepID=A0A4Y2JJL6_ARAVE|nr:hypothetical protein AVEN_20271-1 [Araneus ventricosus]